MNYSDLVNVQKLLIKHKNDGSSDSEIENDLYVNWFHGGLNQILVYPLASDYDACLSQSTEYQTGWFVQRSRLPGMAASVEVSRAGASRFVAAPFVLPENSSSLSFEAGDSVSVCPLQAQEIHGFWHVFSPRWIDEGMPEDRQRLYFNVKPGQEQAFVSAFCSQANFDAPWSLKILCGQSEGPRHDVAVAYLPMTVSVEDGWLWRLLQVVQCLVYGEGPPLTKPMYPGIYWAPDISSNKSFGQLLCQKLIKLAAQEEVLHDDHGWLGRSREALDSVVLEKPQ